MKILFLSDINNVHTKKWVKGILEAGHEVLLFGLAGSKDDYYEDFPKLEIISADFTGQYGASSFSKLKYLKTIKILKSAYSQFNPDIVHAHYATSYGMLGSLLKHKPFLISVWGSDIYNFPNKSIFHKALLKRNLSKADYVFSTSHDMAAETAKYTDKNIQVIPFGVDVNVFRPKSSESADSLTIGVVKTLEPNYGISYLIDAFKIVQSHFPDQNLKLLIVGDGSLKESLMHQTQRLEISDSVAFTGRIDHSEVNQYYNRMDIVVIPSRVNSESFGVAAVEASACAKPVVASNTGGLKEVIRDGINGLLAEPENPEDLAQKIQVLVDDPDLRSRLGKKGREKVIENYDWNKCLEIQIDAYKDILKNIP